jgi:DHA1 family bicyclomycin/chloramphenicol resistance-like MFS transporter
MDVFHVDKKTYGWIFAGLSVAFIGLSQFNGLLLRRYSSHQIVRVALAGQVGVSWCFWLGQHGGMVWVGVYDLLFVFAFLACLGSPIPMRRRCRWHRLIKMRAALLHC